MIPILFEENCTSFESMGIGVLADTTKALIRRVLNGKDELELSYPIDGELFSEIKNSRIILAEPEYEKDQQPYRIYRITKPIKGLVTVYGRHVSELKNYTMVEPFSAASLTDFFDKLPQKIIGEHPFTFFTDKSVASPYMRDLPSSLGSVLGGSAGSALDIYGGEFDFDVYQVRLLNRRGIDRGVSVSYGKNLTNLEVIEAVDETVATSICPIWTGMEESEIVYLPEYVVDSQYVDDYPYRRALVVDFSGDFDEAPTEAQLRAAANLYIIKNDVGLPSVSVKVSFEHLAQYEEYKDYALLETLNLGDTVRIYHTDLGVSISARIVETVFDVLNEKYVNVVVGRMSANMSTTLSGITTKMDAQAKENKNYIVEAVGNATNLITGVKGGYVVHNFDANGYPYEILIMDTPNKSTARNVLRINQNGIGFSKTGYEGPFTTAWTIDGSFVANFITTGSMAGDRIRTGLIQSQAGNSYWNLDTGEFYNSGLATTLSNMQAQIDDAIETFTGAAVPTLNNYPANGWTTAQDKDSHIGDLYVVNSQGGDYEGFYYRFEKAGNVYQWRLLKDTEVTKALADAAEALRIAGEASEAVDESVKDADVEYYKSTSPDNLVGGQWQTTSPTWQEGYYIWIRTKWTQNDGTITYSYPSCISGNTGAKGDRGEKGDTGVSITGVTNYYLATTASSGVTPSTQGWTTTIQNITAAKPYLWNYEVTTGSNGSTISTTTPCIIGRFGKDGTNGTNGQNGRGITSITEYYAVSASDSTAPSSWSTTMVTTDPTNKYLWNYETVSYTDGTTEDTIKRIIGTHGIDGTNGKGIASITEYYATNNSTTAPADSAFSTTVAAPTEAKRYLWNYEQFTYTDGTTSKTNKHIMAVYGQKGDTGAAGTNGTDGVGIDSVTEYYAATNSTTTPADSAFRTTVATMTETNKYLWNYELITYTDTTTERTAKRIIGVYGATGATGPAGQDGDDGVGIASVTELYYCSNSASAPAKPAAHVTTDNITTYNQWNKACATWTDTYKYYYTCVEILYTDGTYGWSDVVKNSGLNTANGNAATAQSKANTALVSEVPVYYRYYSTQTPVPSNPPAKPSAKVTSKATDTNNAWSLVLQKPKKNAVFYTCMQMTDGLGTVTWTDVVEMSNVTVAAMWCNANDATYMDGANLYAGSVTANKIDINDLFAQNITATNFNITGGSININTASGTTDVIRLNYGGHSVKMSPNALSFIDTTNNVYLAQLNPYIGVFSLNDPNYGKIWLSSATKQVVVWENDESKTGTLSETSLKFAEGSPTRKDLVVLDKSGLSFNDANGNVTAAYPATVTEYSFALSNETIGFSSASTINVSKAGKFGKVSVQFLINTDASLFTANTTFVICNLPSQYWPAKRIDTIVTNGAGNPIFIAIRANGEVAFYRYPGTTWTNQWVRAQIPIIYANP